MLKIAICDDEERSCAELEKIILDYSKISKTKITVDVFYTGIDLCEFLEQGEFFDLIFLDIEMDIFNGIDVGKTIRSKLDNQLTHIIYISWKENYCRQLFDIRPTNFLQKPLDKEKIISEICYVEKLTNKISQTFSFKKGHDVYKIPIKDIIYFESVDKTIHLITTKGKYIYYEKMENLLKELEQYRFIQIHRSYIVNYSHIVKFNYDKLELTNETILPISQSRRKDVRELQSKYESEDLVHGTL